MYNDRLEQKKGEPFCSKIKRKLRKEKKKKNVGRFYCRDDDSFVVSLEEEEKIESDVLGHAVRGIGWMRGKSNEMVKTNQQQIYEVERKREGKALVCV